MRRALVASGFFLTLAALSIRALKLTDTETVLWLQLGLAAILFVLAWLGQIIKSRREG
jgi:hypothetical protein